MPQNVELIKAVRKRHQAELDFRTEAANLRECSKNMRRRGFEPRLVRLPRVVDVSRHEIAGIWAAFFSRWQAVSLLIGPPLHAARPVSRIRSLLSSSRSFLGQLSKTKSCLR